MARITGVRTIRLTGPCTNDPWLAHFRPERSVALIEVSTDVGVTGLGETYAGYFFAEAVTPIVDFHADILTGSEPIDEPHDWSVETLVDRMRTCSGFWSRVGLGAAVIAGIEGALWDLKGKLCEQPVWQLLAEPGASVPESLPTYATGGPSPWPVDKFLAKLDFYAELGFTAAKVSTGYLDSSDGQEVRHDPVQTEVDKYDLVTERFGDRFTLLLDGHMGHRVGPNRWDEKTATDVLTALAAYEPVFFEEPLSYHDVDSYARLAAGPVRVAGGEQLTSVAEFEPYARTKAFNLVQPDAAWLGISGYRTVAAKFPASAPHSWGAGVAVMQNLHAAFAASNTSIVEMIPAPGRLHTELWGDSISMDGSRIRRPDAPGLGVRLAPELADEFAFVPGSGEFANVHGKKMPPPRTTGPAA